MPKNTESKGFSSRGSKTTTWTKGNPGKRTMTKGEVKRASKPTVFAPKKK